VSFVWLTIFTHASLPACHKAVCCRDGWTDLAASLAQRQPSTYPSAWFKRIRVSSESRVLPSRLCHKLWTCKNFAAACRPSRLLSTWLDQWPMTTWSHWASTFVYCTARWTWCSTSLRFSCETCCMMLLQLGFWQSETWVHWTCVATLVKGKGKGFPYSTLSVGPGADPSVQAVSRRWP